MIRVAASSLIRVQADDRERGSPAWSALAADPDVMLETQRLEVGDYLVEGKLLVERKALPDLLASIEDGRLFRQAGGLVLSGMPCLLILEGHTGDIAHRAMRREAIQGALVCLSITYGIPVLRSLDGAETARLLLQATRQLRKSALACAHRPGACPPAHRRAQTYVLQGFPGVGRALALRLLERFQSVEAVLTATAEDLQNVPGIGKRRADRIRWVMGQG